jgi:hypothetical protein
MLFLAGFQFQSSLKVTKGLFFPPNFKKNHLIFRETALKVTALDLDQY